MKLMRLRVGSRAETILRSILREGPKTRGELAKILGIEVIVYKYDIEELRDRHRDGYRASPPRRTTKMYPILPGTLSYMSKVDYKRKFTGTETEFYKFYKPWIILADGKWEITEFGIKALEVLDDE